MVDLVETDTAADSGFTVGSSGETAGVATASRECTEGGSGTGTMAPDVGNSATDIERAVVGFQTDTGAPYPNKTQWNSGDYVVNINVTTARAVEWRTTYIMARTSGGSFTTVASATPTPVDLSSTGVKTMTVNRGTDYTANATDTIYVLLVFGAALEHGNSSVTLTMGQNVTIPLLFNRAVTAVTDALVIAEPQGTVNAQRGVAGVLETLAIAEQSSTVNRERGVTGVLETLIIAEQPATVQRGSPVFPYHVVKISRREMDTLLTM